MKKHIRLFSGSLFLPLILAIPQFSRAAGGDEEGTRRRVINKSYNVTANDKLEIENQFGNVIVSTWDKDQITVDIEIVTKATTDEKAQEMMDRVDVKDDQKGNTISFKTQIGDIHDWNGDRKSKDKKGFRSFNIDYVIHMPAANPLELMNSFGKITVPDMKGTVKLTSKFGGLTAGKLSNVDAIHVEFGEASIGEMTNGKLTLKFNKRSEVGKLSGNVKINVEFSDHVALNVDDDISDLSISESYSNIRMVVSKALSADYDIHTSFGEFHNDSGFSLPEKKGDSDETPRFDKDYSGRSGDGKAKIKIRSSFGSVRLSHIGADTAI
jgi:hypothetical protein